MSEVKRSEERTVYYCIVVKMGREWGSGRKGTIITVPPTRHHNTYIVRFVKNPGGGGHGHVQKSLAEIHLPDPKVGHARQMPQAHNLHKMSHVMDSWSGSARDLLRI